MKFEQLDLSDNILDALYDMHFDECTPVQEKCIPEILAGHDVLGVAQTGTGKTAAYLLPILSKLDTGDYPADAINCIIMSPTRELAQQIDQAMQGFAYYCEGVSSVAVYGGNDGHRYDQEVKSLSLGADVVIATPGRFISHISLGNVDLSHVSFFVLDEADRMLDMGFSEDIMTIARKLPQSCQTIMFSATMPDKIEELAKTLLKNPVEVKLAVSKPAEKIKQSAYICHETQKLNIIKNIFKAGDLKRVLIFCGSKMKVKQVAGALQRKHINCGEMHSDLEQSERDEMMYRFKSGKYDVLVATDIVSRGIDIDDIAMVINYDVPHDAEDYVHRIGRTARAERDGIAITLVSDEDRNYFQQIEKFLGKEITKNPLPDGMEGPDYNGTGHKGSTAKSRRRKDRDQTAHKDRKSRSRKNNTRDNTSQEAGKQGDNKSQQPANRAPESGNQPSKHEQRQGKHNASKDNSTKSKEQKGSQRPEKQQKQGKNGKQSYKENGQNGQANKAKQQEAKPNSQKRQRRKQGGKKQDSRAESHLKTTKYNITAPQQKSQKEGLVKKLFHKIFGKG